MRMRRLDRSDGPTLAYRRIEGASPGVLFCCGFNSDMTGTKASALAAWAERRGRACVLFDYQGHGRSDGDMADSTIGAWRRDALAVLDGLTAGPQILVGSSMGAWIATLAALDRPNRVAALVGIGAAPDFTHELLEPALDATRRAALEAGLAVMLPTSYDGRAPVIGPLLIAEAARHRLLDRRLVIAAPVRLLHGLADPDVPWRLGLRLAEVIDGPDTTLTLIRDGDHRLSRPQDVALLLRTLDALVDGR
jgi:pimeloyl-ACP methyl ester carboxylesterase